MPQASSLQAAIKETFQVQAKLIKSSGGVFEVKVNDRLIFSKKQLGRFPSEEEILKLMGELDR